MCFQKLEIFMSNFFATSFLISILVLLGNESVLCTFRSGNQSSLYKCHPCNAKYPANFELSFFFFTFSVVVVFVVTFIVSLPMPSLQCHVSVGLQSLTQEHWCLITSNRINFRIWLTLCHFISFSSISILNSKDQFIFHTYIS